MQGLGILIPQRSIYIVTSSNLASLGSFLQHSPIKKVVFDCRDMADCLFRQHSLTLDNVLDLQIIELVLRGQVGSRVALPMEAVQRDGKIAKVILRDRLFSIDECSKYYLDSRMVGSLDSEILVIEYFRNHFSFLVEFGEILFNGKQECIQPFTEHGSSIIPHDYTYFTTISHRHSKVNSGKVHRDGSEYDTHNLVYGHVIERGVVLSVVECALCHVTQPVDSYSNEQLYSDLRVCNTCIIIRECNQKHGQPRRFKWTCF